MFKSVIFFGDASLASGKLAGEDGKNISSGGLGASAKTEHFDLLASFSFGSEANLDAASTASDYVTFLRTPKSALGGALSLRWLTLPCKIEAPGLWLGATIAARANHQSFAYTNDAGAITQQKVNLFSLDISFTTSIRLSEGQDISLDSQIGAASRFWGKPAASFLNALELSNTGHTFAGLRVMSAITVKNIYVGIELTRFGGTGLGDLKEFAILPYVGIRGGLAEIENESAVSQSANGSTIDKGKVQLQGAAPAPQPHSTPIM
jgi:hypothetical protein